MGINQRVSLRKFIDDIRRWVEEDRSDEWIASALGTSPSSVQSFRSRNAIYRRGAASTLYEPRDFSFYEGVLERRGRHLVRPRDRQRFALAETLDEHREDRAAPHPTRIVLLRRGGGRGPAATR